MEMRIHDLLMSNGFCVEASKPSGPKAYPKDIPSGVFPWQAAVLH
jgi:hypothetical protein